MRPNWQILCDFLINHIDFDDENTLNMDDMSSFLTLILAEL